MYATLPVNVATTAVCFLIGGHRATMLGVIGLVVTIASVPGIYLLRYMLTHPKR
jgi:hypothetical protein